MSAEVRENLGTRRIVKLPPVRFPDADAIVRERAAVRARDGNALRRAREACSSGEPAALAQKKWGPALLPAPTAPSEGSAGLMS